MSDIRIERVMVPRYRVTSASRGRTFTKRRTALWSYALAKIDEKYNGHYETVDDSDYFGASREWVCDSGGIDDTTRWRIAKRFARRWMRRRP